MMIGLKNLGLAASFIFFGLTGLIIGPLLGYIIGKIILIIAIGFLIIKFLAEIRFKFRFGHVHPVRQAVNRIIKRHKKDRRDKNGKEEEITGI